MLFGVTLLIFVTNTDGVTNNSGVVISGAEGRMFDTSLCLHCLPAGQQPNTELATRSHLQPQVHFCCRLNIPMKTKVSCWNIKIRSDCGYMMQFTVADPPHTYERAHVCVSRSPGLSWVEKHLVINSEMFSWHLWGRNHTHLNTASLILAYSKKTNIAKSLSLSWISSSQLFIPSLLRLVSGCIHVCPEKIYRKCFVKLYKALVVCTRFEALSINHHFIFCNFLFVFFVSHATFKLQFI